MKWFAASLIPSILWFDNATVLACPQCRPLVKSGVYNQDFGANLFVLLLPLAVLFAIGIATYFVDAITAKSGEDKGDDAWQTTHSAGR